VVDTSRKQALGSGRRWLFRIWIGATIVMAVLAAFWAPISEEAHAGMGALAALIPPLMILLLSGGLGWLVWVVLARRRSGPQR
jgi:hypothetical protein